jgi:hypothetical protein
MTTCARFTGRPGKIFERFRLRFAGAGLVAICAAVSAHAQVPDREPPTPSISLNPADLNDLIASSGKVETVEYLGRKAVRLTAQGSLTQ